MLPSQNICGLHCLILLFRSQDSCLQIHVLLFLSHQISQCFMSFIFFLKCVGDHNVFFNCFTWRCHCISKLNLSPPHLHFLFSSRPIHSSDLLLKFWWWMCTRGRERWINQCIGALFSAVIFVLEIYEMLLCSSTSWPSAEVIGELEREMK